MMANEHHLIEVQYHDQIAVVRLKQTSLDETEIHDLTRHLLELNAGQPCSRVILCLGPQTPFCLYSVFLARLISLQRKLTTRGGGLKLCECSPEVLEILDVCLLTEQFDLVPTVEQALSEWGALTNNGIQSPLV